LGFENLREIKLEIWGSQSSQDGAFASWNAAEIQKIKDRSLAAINAFERLKAEREIPWARPRLQIYDEEERLLYGEIPASPSRNVPDSSSSADTSS